MVAQRRLDSQLKRQRVIAAVDARLAAGHELSVAALARHAGVSRKFIYAHPDLRPQIEQRAHQATRPARQQRGRGGRVTIASLRADAANAKAQNAPHANRCARLSSGSQTMLGRQVASEIDPAGYEPPEQLRANSRRAGTGVRARGDARRRQRGARSRP